MTYAEAKALLQAARSGCLFSCGALADYYEEQGKTTRAIGWRLLAWGEVIIEHDPQPKPRRSVVCCDTLLPKGWNTPPKTWKAGLRRRYFFDSKSYSYGFKDFPHRLDRWVLSGHSPACCRRLLFAWVKEFDVTLQMPERVSAHTTG